MPEFVPVGRKRQRLTFGRARDLVEIPDMIEVQRESYRWFYQESIHPDERAEQGLQELLHEVFPIESYDGTFALEFVKFFLDEPSTEEEEARQRDLTWSGLSGRRSGWSTGRRWKSRKKKFSLATFL